MQFFSYLSNGQVRSGCLINGNIGIDIQNAYLAYHGMNNDSLNQSAHFPNSILDIFSRGESELQTVRVVIDWIQNTYTESEADYRRQGVVIDFDKVDLLAPIPVPGKVICIAGNYPAQNKLDKPEHPTIFLKPSGSVIGSYLPVQIPAIAANVAFEVELAVVIGRTARHLSMDEASSYIAGYTIANDLGDRLLEKRTSQWTSGKMFDTFTPIGPILITKDELPDIGHLAMTTIVNGQVVQKGCTSEMFFDVPYLVSELSELTTLQPGDVILTGSPKLMDGQPNPSVNLKPGDTVEVWIERIGTLSNPIIEEKVIV